MSDTTTKLPTPFWMKQAIVGFPGECSDPTPAFVEAAADRVWQTMVALAELRGRDEHGDLLLRLNVEAFADSESVGHVLDIPPVQDED